MSSITCTTDDNIRMIELADAAREIVAAMTSENPAMVVHTRKGLVVAATDGSQAIYDGDDTIAQAYLNALGLLWGRSPMDLFRAVEDLHAHLRRVRRDVSYDRSDLTHTTAMAWGSHNRRRESDPTILIGLLDGQVIRKEYKAA